MKEGFRVPIIKHLEDENDLLQGRDSDLVSGQETSAEAIAEEIQNLLETEDYRIAVFTVSPKKRAQQTAHMVRQALSEKSGLRIIYKTENDLREIDQGVFILPEEYQPGDSYAGLREAGKIFSDETFNPTNPSSDNLLYRFGDPVLRTDGTYKYPSIAEKFTSPGENYRDVLVRLYRQVVLLSEQVLKYEDRAIPVVFTHGQPHQIFTDLAEVADLVERKQLDIETGTLPRVCWDLYQQRRKGVVPYGKTNFVALDHIQNTRLIEILKNELAYLESLRVT